MLIYLFFSAKSYLKRAGKEKEIIKEFFRF